MGALAGISSDQLNNSIQFLSRNLGQLKTVEGGPLKKFLEKTDPALLQRLMSADVNTAFDAAIEAMQGKSPEVQAAIAQAFFGRGGMPIARLAQMGDLNKIREEFRRLGGEVGAFDVARASAYSDALIKLGAAWRGLLDAIASRFIDTKFLDWFTELIAANKEAIATNIVGVFNSLKDALMGVDWASIGSSLMEVAKGANTFAQAIGGWDVVVPVLLGLRFFRPVVGMFASFALILGGLTQSLAGGAGLMAAMGPGGWLVLGAAALAGAGYLLYQNWDKIKPAWDAVAGAAQNLWKALEPIGTAVNNITKALTGKSVGELFAGISDVALSAIGAALQTVATAINAIAKAIELISKSPDIFNKVMGLVSGGGAGLGAGIYERFFGGGETTPETTPPGGAGPAQPQSAPGAPTGGSTLPVGTVAGRALMQGATAVTPFGNFRAASELVGQLKGLVDELIGVDTAAAAAASAPPTGAGAPQGITIQAKGPNVHVNQAPPNVNIGVTVNVASPDASPAATGTAVGNAIAGRVRGGLYDGVSE
jgi:hypothetical protein